MSAKLAALLCVDRGKIFARSRPGALPANLSNEKLTNFIDINRSFEWG
jgi:hypothetical protein